MPLDRAWIETRIPHHGRMCLLDEVLDWDAHRIRCRSGTHRCADHVLRAYGRLGVACGIEYAAQAMAVHGVLVAGPAAGSPRAGYLASVRGVRLEVARLDDIAGDLICEATRVAGDQDSVVYEFAIRAAKNQIGYSAHGTDIATLLSGRATIALQDAKRP